MSGFEARHPGHCPACDERIVPGEQVTYSQDNELIHWVCSAPDDGPAYSMSDFVLGPLERLCPQCFTIHAGECL